jgi:hypothetical protein
MSTHVEQPTTASALELTINTLIKGWVLQITRTTDLVNSLTDEQLKNETAPGRNSGVYLLGHLVASNEGILTLLGAGEKLYPQLENPFLKSADKSGHEFPSIEELKKYWNDVSGRLLKVFNETKPEDWVTRHTAVSEEDFAKEPHRNKLNILISRMNHVAYHLGQLAYLKTKK